MNKKIKIALVFLMSTSFLGMNNVFAKSEDVKIISKNEKKESGYSADFQVKVKDKLIEEEIKFKLVNKTYSTEEFYKVKNGILSNMFVKEKEEYVLELEENEKYIMKPLEITFKKDIKFFAVNKEGLKILDIIVDKIEENNDANNSNDTNNSDEFNNLPNWKNENGMWRYYYEDGTYHKGWLNDKKSNSWYYFDEKGYRLTGWILNNNNYYYLKSDGKMATGWITHNNQKYFLNTYGDMRKSSWLLYAGRWYYFGRYGDMKIGWIKDNNQWYYFDTHGNMKTGWISYNGNWYYLGKYGDMKTGWLYEKGKWYYLYNSGIMATKWLKTDKWYYFNSDGSWNPTGVAYSDWSVLNGYFITNDGSRTANVGEDYIIISLSDQKLWLFRNNKLIKNSGIISGKPKTPTVVGNFSVQYKERNRKLTGEDYSVWVDYWMPFYWDYGIHDANWQRYSSFEYSDSYLYSGSHGCVNIYPGDMGTIYRNSYIGMPVIVIN